MSKKQYRKLTDEMMKEISEYAIACYLEESEKSRKSQYDKRLRNTKLLLKNYRELVAHSQNAVFEASRTNDDDLYDILDAMGGMNGRIYVNSIKASAIRTSLIISHVNEMLKIYQILCERSGVPEDMRRFRVINALYIQENPKTREQIAEEENVDKRTIFRDVNVAVEKLTSLIFGIDGLSQY